MDQFTAWLQPFGTQAAVPSDEDCLCEELPLVPAPGPGLTSQGRKIQTPGGFVIEALGKNHAFTITGPDGASTRIWGDPHVVEGDGGKWDFKKDIVFELGDGTRIWVRTTPYKDTQATVTASLEVVHGGQRSLMLGVDGADPVATGVEALTAAQGESFAAGLDVFHMGARADDWTLRGKEVVGSANGGVAFKLADGTAVEAETGAAVIVVTEPAPKPAAAVRAKKAPQAKPKG
jgi:hypothetical protein